jgi:predicted transposase YdaD
VNDFNGIARDNLDQWIYYLKNDAIPDRFTAPGLPEARERLLVNSLSSSERAAYYAHIEYLQNEYSVVQTAEDKGLYKGRAEGEEERKKLQKKIELQEKNLAQKDEVLAQKDNVIANAVKNLVKQGLSPQQIAQIMQLDVEEVMRMGR